MYFDIATLNFVEYELFYLLLLFPCYAFYVNTSIKQKPYFEKLSIAKFVDTWNFAKKTVLSSMIYQLLVYDFRAKRKINYPRTTGTCSHKIVQQSRTFKVKFIIILVVFRGFHISLLILSDTKDWLTFKSLFRIIFIDS